MANILPEWTCLWKKGNLPTSWITQKTLEETINILELDENCPIKDTFEKMNNGKYKVKTPEQSSVMSWHLKEMPIVPWVIQKWLILDELWLTSMVFDWTFATETQFLNPIISWDIIFSNIKEKALYKQDNKKVCEIHPYYWDLNIKDLTYTKSLEKKLNSKKLDNRLLQNWNFRFVDWVSLVSQAEENTLNVWDIFQWFYKIPKNFLYTKDFLRKKIVPSYLLEDMAAQIWVFAFWEINWNTLDENWNLNNSSKTLTFNTSVSHFYWVIKPLDTLKIVWRITELSKRQVSFEYVWFNQHNEKIIFWQIIWNIVPIKILKRFVWK